MGDFGDLLDTEAVDPCSQLNFQINMNMPPTLKGLVEPDIDLYSIAV